MSTGLLRVYQSVRTLRDQKESLAVKALTLALSDLLAAEAAVCSADGALEIAAKELEKALNYADLISRQGTTVQMLTEAARFVAHRRQGRAEAMKVLAQTRETLEKKRLAVQAARTALVDAKVAREIVEKTIAALLQQYRQIRQVQTDDAAAEQIAARIEMRKLPWIR